MAKRILVPLDRSALGAALIPVVADTARGSHAIVRLLHVAPLPANRVSGEGRVVAYADQEMERLSAEALDYLETVEPQLDGVPVERAVRFGDAAAEILREAEAAEVDLIAVSTGKRSGIARELLGSVAEQVLRRAEVPVMLVRPRRPQPA